MTNEQIAHDLAVAVAAAKLNQKSNLSADISLVSDYDNAYRYLLDLVQRTR
ncbi:hypothetical protein [Pediococcus pentosaceus]